MELLVMCNFYRYQIVKEPSQIVGSGSPNQQEKPSKLTLLLSSDWPGVDARETDHSVVQCSDSHSVRTFLTRCVSISYVVYLRGLTLSCQHLLILFLLFSFFFRFQL